MNAKDIEGLGNEVAKYLYMGLAGGLIDNSKEAVRAFRGFYEKLKYQRDFDLISEDEYYRSLENLRDRYFTEGTDNWVRYTQKIYAYQKKTLENEKKQIISLYDDVSDYAVKKLDEVIKKQQGLATELSEAGPLYKKNKVIIGDSIDHYYSLGDMDRDIEMINRYSDSMNRVKIKAETLGVSDSAKDRLMSELKGLEMEEAMGFLSALLVAGDDKFVHYSEALEEKYRLSDNVAAKQFETEFDESWKSSYAYMMEEFEKAGIEIPKGFSVSGSISAEKFGEAFLSELDAQLERVRSRVDTFNASLSFDAAKSGDTYNTTNTSYNIVAKDGDTVEQIKRFEAVKRLSGAK